MSKEHLLDRWGILEAALALADEEGLGAAAMRRVARLVGVGTMSLYHHVPNKEALLEGMVELTFEGVEQPPHEMQGWTDRVVYISLSFRRG